MSRMATGDSKSAWAENGAEPGLPEVTPAPFQVVPRQTTESAEASAVAANWSGSAGVDPTGRITSAMTCTSCGYPLYGLLVHNSCPECGTPIRASIGMRFLRFADPEWVRRLALGMRLLIWGSIISVAVVIGSSTIVIAIMGPNGPGIYLVAIGGQLLGILSLIGYWLLSERNPAESNLREGISARVILRWLPPAVWVAGWLASPLSGAMMRTPMPTNIPAILLTLVSTALGIVVFLALGVRLRSLATLIPKESLVRQTTIVMWGYCSAAGLSFLALLAMMALTGVGMITPTPGAAAGALLMVVFSTMCAVSLASFVFAIWALVVGFMYVAELTRQAEAAKHCRHLIGQCS